MRTRTFSGIIILGLCCSVFGVRGARADDGSDGAYEQAQKHMRSAYLYVKGKKLAGAMREYRKALDLMPFDADLLYNLVSVAKAEDRCDDVMLYGSAFLGVAGGSKEAVEVRQKREACTQRNADRAGRLQIVDAPPGVFVAVDGVEMGRAPLRKLWLAAGSHEIRLHHEDYEELSTVAEVKPGETQEVAGALVALVFSGYLQVKTEPADGVQVYVDEKPVGVTPLGPIALSTGRVLVRFEAPGYDRWVRYVDIRKEETEGLFAALEATDEPEVSKAPTQH